MLKSDGPAAHLSPFGTHPLRPSSDDDDSDQLLLGGRVTTGVALSRCGRVTGPANA